MISLANPAAAQAQGGQVPNEPVHKSVIRCLSDMDDLLDTIHDPASFALVKPRLLSRAREQKALASANPNQGMSQLSRSAAQEMQKAVNRHTKRAQLSCDSSGPRRPRILREGHRRDPECKIAAHFSGRCDISATIVSFQTAQESGVASVFPTRNRRRSPLPSARTGRGEQVTEIWGEPLARFLAIAEAWRAD